MNMSISSISIISTVLITPVAIIIMIRTISTCMGPKITPARRTPMLIHRRHKTTNRWPCIPVIVPIMISWRRVWNPWYHIAIASWRELIYWKGWRRWCCGRVGKAALCRTRTNVAATSPLHRSLSIRHMIIRRRIRFCITSSRFLRRAWRYRGLQNNGKVKQGDKTYQSPPLFMYL